MDITCATLFALLVSCFGARKGSRNYRIREGEGIAWNSGSSSQIRELNMANRSAFAYYCSPPANSSESIKVTVISLESELGSVYVGVKEKALKNGPSFERKRLNRVSDSVLSSPYTTLELHVINSNPSTPAVIQLLFELQNESCSYPFVVARTDMPVRISTADIASECDFYITCERGYELELTSIIGGRNGTSRPITIELFDSSCNKFLRRIEESEFAPDMRELLLTDAVILHISNPLNSASTASITIGAVDAGCKCPDAEVWLTNATAKFTFRIEKAYCYYLSCTTTISIPEELRHHYRIKVSNSAGVTDGMFLLKDGISDGLLIWETEDKTYVSVHHSVEIVYKDMPRPIHAQMVVSLQAVDEYEQGLCNCPLMKKASTGYTINMIIPAFCQRFDCVWTFDTPNLPAAGIQVHKNSKSRRPEELYVTKHYGNIYWTFLAFESSDYLIQRWGMRYLSDDTTIKLENAVLHYDRWGTLSEESIRQNETSVYNITLTDYVSFLAYENACGCFNSTLVLTDSSEQTVTSPNYPNHYCSDLRCETKVIAPEGSVVAFKLYTLSLEPDVDFLYIYEIAENTTILRESYTGRYLDGFTTESRTNQMLIVFKSNEIISYDGFNATVFSKPSDTWDDYEDVGSSGVSPAFIVLGLAVAAVVVLLAGVVVLRRKQSAPYALSFSPVSYWNPRNTGEEQEANMVRFN